MGDAFTSRASLVAAQLGDLLTTGTALSLVGLSGEGNPVIVALLVNYGWGSVVALKVVACLAIILTWPKMPTKMRWVLAVFTWLVVVNNMLALTLV